VRRAADRSLAGAVEIRLQDYRDVTDGPYDAISTVEMGEHVGADQYPGFAAGLFGLLAPRGRLLVQQMSRGRNAPGGGAFIEAYVAPDIYMRPVGETVALFEAAGFEIRDVHALREHYVRTVRVWLDNLEDRWAQAVDLVGEPVARVWRLYLAGGALAFEEGRMGVDQILAVRPADDGASGMPAVRL
jgi:cyclopropane-fatty-acyl-phospholipid synthase